MGPRLGIGLFSWHPCLVRGGGVARVQVRAPGGLACAGPRSALEERLSDQLALLFRRICLFQVLLSFPPVGEEE